MLTIPPHKQNLKGYHRWKYCHIERSIQNILNPSVKCFPEKTLRWVQSKAPPNCKIAKIRVSYGRLREKFDFIFTFFSLEAQFLGKCTSYLVWYSFFHSLRIYYGKGHGFNKLAFFQVLSAVTSV